MKKALKITALVAGGFIVVGLCLALLGSSIGGGFYSLSFLDGHPVVYRTGENNPFGKNVTVSKETVSPFSSIEINADFMDIDLYPSSTDQWEVESRYTSNNVTAPVIHVTDGNVLTIDTDSTNLSRRLIGDVERSVIVYYPEGSEFDTIRIRSNLGDISLRSIATKSLVIDSDAGDISLYQITADTSDVVSNLGSIDLQSCVLKNTSLDLDAGDIDGEQLQCENFSAHSSLGDMELEGDFRGKTDLSTSAGDIDITLEGKKEDYALALDGMIDGVSLDGNDIHSAYEEGSGKQDSLSVRVDFGEIDVEFYGR